MAIPLENPNFTLLIIFLKNMTKIVQWSILSSIKKKKCGAMLSDSWSIQPKFERTSPLAPPSLRNFHCPDLAPSYQDYLSMFLQRFNPGACERTRNAFAIKSSWLVFFGEHPKVSRPFPRKSLESYDPTGTEDSQSCYHHQFVEFINFREASVRRHFFSHELIVHSSKGPVYSLPCLQDIGYILTGLT